MWPLESDPLKNVPVTVVRQVIDDYRLRKMNDFYHIYIDQEMAENANWPLRIDNPQGFFLKYKPERQCPIVGK